MKIFSRILLFMLLAAALAGGYVAYEAKLFLSTPPTESGADMLFDVEQGASLPKVAAALQQKGLITDARKFSWLARWKKLDSRLQAGRFALNTGWLPEKILDQLVNGQPLLYRITIREGLTWWEVAHLLEDAGFVRFDDFKSVIFDPDFLRHHGIPFKNAEGFLMPNTYLLKKADAPDQAAARVVANRLVDTFRQKTAPLWPGGSVPKAEDLRRLIILASIVEKETAVPSERARVAGVYANRLKISMALQADPTVIYGLGEKFDGNIKRVHLNDPQNPYNTYQRPGLPPGPICSPGLASIRAALKPEEHNFLYFVAKTDGGEHNFSATLQEHNKAVRQYLDNRKAVRQNSKNKENTP